MMNFNRFLNDYFLKTLFSKFIFIYTSCKLEVYAHSSSDDSND